MISNQRRYKSKIDSYRSAVKVWTCKNCGVQHVAKKPTDCMHCNFNDFYYFASQFEANRFAELSLMQKIGQIKDLKTQVTYCFKVNSLEITTYRLDFQYTNTNTGQMVYEDTKGHEKSVSEEFKIKQKLMAACYGVDVKIIYQNRSKKK